MKNFKKILCLCLCTVALGLSACTNDIGATKKAASGSTSEVGNVIAAGSLKENELLTVDYNGTKTTYALEAARGYFSLLRLADHYYDTIDYAYDARYNVVFLDLPDQSYTYYGNCYILLRVVKDYIHVDLD